MSRSKLFLISSIISAVAGVAFLILAGILIGIILASGTMLPISSKSISMLSGTPTESSVAQLTPTPAVLADTRAMWVLDQNVVLDADDQAELFAFAESKAINELYVDAFSLLREDPEALRQFIGRASQQGIRVDFLAGNSSWTQRANHFVPLAFLRETIAFAQSSLPEQRPVGLLFDIKPYVLGNDWPVSEYLTLLESLIQEAQGSGLTVAVAIPFWFDVDELRQFHNGQELPLSHHILSIVDRVVILDFRDFAEGGDGLSANIETEMEFAARLGKPVTIGIETQCGEPDPPKVTFCEEGEVILFRELEKVKAAYGRSSSWGGIAIHDYTSYHEIIPYACPEDNRFTIVDPPGGSHTSSRFISVQGCGGNPGIPVRVYVVISDGPHLQDNEAIPGQDGRWKLDNVVLGGLPLPHEHEIYAVTGRSGAEIRSDPIIVIKQAQ